jgi:RNA methyltransferase, RsmE family
MNIILFDKGVRRFEKGDERYVHLKKVLHATVGYAFRAGEFSGMGGKAVVTGMDDEEITFDFTPEEDLSALHPVTLLLAQVRPICMRRILRETVSLGVDRLILFISDLGEKSYSDATLYTGGGYIDILKDGAMQSGFTGLPEVKFYSSLDAALKDPLEGERLLLDPKTGERSLSSYSFDGCRAVLAIGPERGWSDRERSLFEKNGFEPLLMGKRILRTETAVVTGLSLTLSGMRLI